MAFVSTIPVDPKTVRKDAKHAAEMKYADEQTEWFKKPRIVTVEQLKAYALEREAQNLITEIGYRIQRSGLTQHKAGLAKIQLDNAIKTAKQVMDESNETNKTKSTRLLTKANRSIMNVNKMFASAILSMKRGGRGGTLRRKSVKRCKS
jgi:hypothetical protein